MVDGEMLRAEIDDLGISKGRLAEKCHMSRQTLNNKLDNPDTITAEEAYLMADALRITDTDRLMRIFFTRRVE